MTKLEQALELARGRPAMASVRVQWNPYEAGWFAQADWSLGPMVETPCYKKEEQALDSLIELLKREL